MEVPMSKPLHPAGIHRLKLVMVNKSKFGPLVAQCIFEGTGINKGCYTISRLISKYGRWAESSLTFLVQLGNFDHDKELADEISKYIGQEFICRIPKQGARNQMNISTFLPVNINSETHVKDETVTGQSQVEHV
jgi:hypothetical protein